MDPALPAEADQSSSVHCSEVPSSDDRWPPMTTLPSSVDVTVVVWVPVEAPVVAVPVTAVFTAKAPVRARNEPTLTAAAVRRACWAGWGRLRRAAGCGAVGRGEGLASMSITLRPVPVNSRRAVDQTPGSCLQRR